MKLSIMNMLVAVLITSEQNTTFTPYIRQMNYKVKKICVRCILWSKMTSSDQSNVIICSQEGEGGKIEFPQSSYSNFSFFLSLHKCNQCLRFHIPPLHIYNFILFSQASSDIHKSIMTTIMVLHVGRKVIMVAFCVIT